MTAHLRRLAADAEGAWGGEWRADVAYPVDDPGLYGVWSEHGPMIGGSCEEVAVYVAAIQPSVLVGLLDELAIARRELDRLRDLMAQVVPRHSTTPRIDDDVERFTFVMNLPRPPGTTYWVREVTA